MLIRPLCYDMFGKDSTQALKTVALGTSVVQAGKEPTLTTFTFKPKDKTENTQSNRVDLKCSSQPNTTMDVLQTVRSYND